MRCDEFNERLNEVLDRRLPPADDATLMSHAGECSSCRRHLRTWEAIDTVLSDEDRPALPVNLAANVVANVVAEVASPATRGPGNSATLAWVATSLALAASLLVGVVLFFGQAESPPVVTMPEETPAASSDLVAEPPAPPESFAAVPPAEEPAETTSLTQVPPPNTTDPVATDYSQWYERLSQQSSQSPYLLQSTWVEPVSATVRPLTTSLQTAIDHPVPRPIAATFTTAIHAVRTSEPQPPLPLPPGPQSALPHPTDRPQAVEFDLTATAHLG